MSDIRDPETDQVLPAPNDNPSIHDQVVTHIEGAREACEDILPDLTDRLMTEFAARKALGVSKYGTPLQIFNGRSMVRDALDEALDLTVYLRGALTEFEAEGYPHVEGYTPEASVEALQDAYENALQAATTLTIVLMAQEAQA